MTYSLLSAIPWFVYAAGLFFLTCLLVGSWCRAAARGDELVGRSFAEWEAEELEFDFDVWRERGAA